MIQLSPLFFSSEPQLLCGIDVALCFYLLLICKLCFLYNVVFLRVRIGVCKAYFPKGVGRTSGFYD